MDTQKDCKIPQCGNLAELAKCKTVVGAKQLRKALESGRARFVYLAENADPAITEPIEQRCRENRIGFAWVSTMTELGNACGIQVGAAVAAVIDSI